MAFIRRFKNISSLLLAGVLAVTLLGPFSCPRGALADDVSDAQDALAQAEERMKQIQEEYAVIQAEIDDLQVQIDGAVDGVMAAQSEVQAGRARLGSMCASEYKEGGFSLLKVLFESKDISELIDNLHYFDVMQQAQSDEIELQRQREAAFSAAYESLNEKKDEQMSALEEAAKKSAEAEQVVANATAQLSKAESEAAEAERLAALQRQAEAMAAEQASASSSAGAEQAGEQESAATGEDGSSNVGQGSSDNSSSSGSGGSDVGDAQSGWRTGAASAYGSKSDGTLGAYTATGAQVTETSMGVAIPMSWPNYQSYFGRTVEINYNGITVFATVNDCGSMGGGARSLDLQPGVWKALGASSCFDWGVRTVSYRFL